jgi:hypothetical protein
VLLGRAGGVVDDEGAVVWFVCSGWGLRAVVHRRQHPGKSASRLRTGICTVGAVTGGVAVPKVFGIGPACGRRSALGPLPNPGGEFFDVIEDFASLGHLGEDFALGVHDRGVIAAECLPDLRQ